MDHKDTQLRKYLYDEGIDPDLRRLVHAISVASKYISAKINEANRKLSGTQNASNDEQLELDKVADLILEETIRELDYIGEYASEERDEAIVYNNHHAKYSVALDPLDGSSLVDVNLSIGTIVGIHYGKSVLKHGRNLAASFYILYGPLTTMVYTSGQGVCEFVLNPEGEFILTQKNIKMNDKGKIYSPGGLKKLWTDEHTNYIKTLENDDYKLRYSGGLVPDVNQLLMKKGGVFSYPALQDAPTGKLRLLFELQPLAFLCEQAGGLAT
ncbi:MAG: fructose-1,6-bisphosphatase, partial [Candidatus Sericytochromatia bacterium]|nr:fructose-1,6-bisphosphatase [Candidatus Sericytochromatia bacterium]